MLHKLTIGPDHVWFSGLISVWFCSISVYIRSCEYLQFYLLLFSLILKQICKLVCTFVVCLPPVKQSPRIEYRATIMENEIMEHLKPSDFQIKQ